MLDFPGFGMGELPHLDCESAEPPKPWKFKVAQKWLKSDFWGPPPK